MSSIVPAAFLTGVYLAAVGSLTWGDALVAAAVGAAIARWGRAGGREHRWTIARLAGVPRLAVGILLELARGSATMTRVLTGRQSARRGRLIAVPVGTRTAGGLVVTALVTTAAPGSAVLDVEARHGQLRLHAIDGRDPAATRAAIERFYERHQRQVAP